MHDTRTDQTAATERPSESIYIAKSADFQLFDLRFPLNFNELLLFHSRRRVFTLPFEQEASQHTEIRPDYSGSGTNRLHVPLWRHFVPWTRAVFLLASFACQQQRRRWWRKFGEWGMRLCQHKSREEKKKKATNFRKFWFHFYTLLSALTFFADSLRSRGAFFAVSLSTSMQLFGISPERDTSELRRRWRFRPDKTFLSTTPAQPATMRWELEFFYHHFYVY